MRCGVGDSSNASPASGNCLARRIAVCCGGRAGEGRLRRIGRRAH